MGYIMTLLSGLIFVNYGTRLAKIPYDLGKSVAMELTP